LFPSFVFSIVQCDFTTKYVVKVNNLNYSVKKINHYQTLIKIKYEKMLRTLQLIDTRLKISFCLPCREDGYNHYIENEY